MGRSTLRGHALHMPGKPARPIAKAELPLEGGQLSALVSGDSHFLGTCEEAGVSALYDHLGVSTPPDCLALPIRVGPRAALLLLADNAAQPVDHCALPIATVVVQQLSAALERLIRTIKSRHTSAIPGVNAEAPAHLSADAAPIHEEPSRITQELLLRVEGRAAGVTAGLNAFDSTEWALPEDWDDVDALQTAPEGGPARQTRLFGAFEQPQRGAIDPDPASERESVEAPTARLPEVAPEPAPTERVVVDDGGDALTEKIVVAGAVDLGASTSPLKGRATTQPTPNAAVKAPTRPTSSVAPQHAKAAPPSRQTLDPPARANETKPARASLRWAAARERDAAHPESGRRTRPAARDLQPGLWRPRLRPGDPRHVVLPTRGRARREHARGAPDERNARAHVREQRAIAEAIFEAPNDVLVGWLDDEDGRARERRLRRAVEPRPARLRRAPRGVPGRSGSTGAPSLRRIAPCSRSTGRSCGCARSSCSYSVRTSQRCSPAKTTTPATTRPAWSCRRPIRWRSTTWSSGSSITTRRSARSRCTS